MDVLRLLFRYHSEMKKQNISDTQWLTLFMVFAPEDWI